MPAITQHIVNSQGGVSFYRVRCTDVTDDRSCSCTSPSDVLVSGGGRCWYKQFIQSSYPDPDPDKNTWHVSCGTVLLTRTGTGIGDLNFDQTSGPMEIVIVCAKTQ